MFRWLINTGFCLAVAVSLLHLKSPAEAQNSLEQKVEPLSDEEFKACGDVLKRAEAILRSITIDAFEYTQKTADVGQTIMFMKTKGCKTFEPLSILASEKCNNFTLTMRRMVPKSEKLLTSVYQINALCTGEEQPNYYKLNID